MATNSKACANCAFFDAELFKPTVDEIGRCRRQSPQVDVGIEEDEDDYSRLGGTTAVWPIVRAFDWCGEFKAGSPEEL
jgi:hypothetical protein